MNRHPMSVMVSQIDLRLARASVSHGALQRAFLPADLPSVLIAMHQDVVPAKTAHHLLPQVAGHSFRSLVPVRNLAEAVHQVHAHLELVDYAMKHVGRRRFGHARLRSLHRPKTRLASVRNARANPHAAVPGKGPL